MARAQMTARAEGRKSEAPRWVVAAGLTGLVAMDALNGTIFSIARSQIMGAAGAIPDEAAWINLSYLIAKLACLPAAAWVVDRFGETRALLWSIALLLVASLVCALVISLPGFVAARGAQGVAGAVLLVAAQSILLRLFPAGRQGLVQALYALGVVMAPTSLAPAVQGWLVDDFSWTWVFWLNWALAPLGLICLTLFKELLPNTRQAVPVFDWLGFGLFSAAMGALVYVLLEGARWNWFEESHITFWAIFGCAALGLSLARVYTGTAQRGFFDASVFAVPQFAFGFFVSFIAGFALFGSAFLIPAFALNVLGMPPLEAGMLLLPASLTIGLGLVMAGGVITAKNLNPVKFVPFGIILMMISMWMLSRSTLESGTADLWGALAARGMGLGFLFLAVTLITLSDLKSAQIATGVGLFNFGRQMGGIVGISFLTTYLGGQIALNRRILIENINPASPAFQQRQRQLIEALTNRGLDPGVANEGAAFVIQKGLQAQVAALSFDAAFFSLVLLFVIAVPLIIVFKVLQKRSILERMRSSRFSTAKNPVQNSRSC
jgi:DHA2 family multidrug resistance protein